MRVHIPNRAHWLRRCFDDKPKKFTASRQHTIPVDSCAIWAHLAVSLPLRSDMQKARQPHNGRAIYFVVCVSPKRSDACALADVLGCVCFNVYEVVSFCGWCLARRSCYTCTGDRNTYSALAVLHQLHFVSTVKIWWIWYGHKHEKRIPTLQIHVAIWIILIKICNVHTFLHYITPQIIKGSLVGEMYRLWEPFPISAIIMES